MKIPYRFTPFPEHILDALDAYRIPARHERVLRAVMRLTLGNKRASGSPAPIESYEIPKRRIRELLKMDEANGAKALKAMVEARMLILVSRGVTTRSGSVYAVNHNVEEWNYPLEVGSNRPSLGVKTTRSTGGQIDPSLGVKTTPGRGSIQPAVGERNALSDAGSSSPLEKKREEERSPLPPKGSGEQVFLVEKLLYEKLVQKFYPFGGVARVAQSSIRDFVAAYRDNVKAAVAAVQAAADEVQVEKPDLVHPIVPTLNLAAAKLAAVGIHKAREEKARVATTAND